ncbi:MAG TPA: neutral zinc metallopeptidase, partial [Candidatus Angelobacter sp.]|nr:neutral zinc metallopeptidase [Candidatus Angelobacter sp.]
GISGCTTHHNEEKCMRWTPGGTSGDIEDRRDDGGGGFGFGGFGGFHIGIGGMLILLILSLVFHRNFFTLLSGGGASTSVSRPDHARDAQESSTVQFVSFVLDDTQKTWTDILRQQGIPYRHAKLVLFRDATYSGCGTAQSATGPFYCPVDEKVYIDLGFYDELKRRFGAPGDFAEAYVLAHEIGHHVQKLMGIEPKVSALERNEPSQRNALSVKLELQADCFAGVWAHSTEQRNLLEKGDAESAINAAAAVGDDRLQKMSTGHVSPETFTHGSSAQRTQWFKQGMDQGTVSACNTFQ